MIFLMLQLVFDVLNFLVVFLVFHNVVVVVAKN